MLGNIILTKVINKNTPSITSKLNYRKQKTYLLKKFIRGILRLIWI